MLRGIAILGDTARDSSWFDLVVDSLAEATVRFGSPVFCGGNGVDCSELPEPPEIAGKCLPELPENAYLLIGEYGVAHIKLFLMK